MQRDKHWSRDVQDEFIGKPAGVEWDVGSEAHTL